MEKQHTYAEGLNVLPGKWGAVLHTPEVLLHRTLGVTCTLC